MFKAIIESDPQYPSVPEHTGEKQSYPVELVWTQDAFHEPLELKRWLAGNIPAGKTLPPLDPTPEVPPLEIHSKED
jgi:hypothetical protein